MLHEVYYSESYKATTADSIVTAIGLIILAFVAFATIRWIIDKIKAEVIDIYNRRKR